MKCSECGADLIGAEKFCSNCGAAVPSGKAAPSDAAATAAPSEFAQPDPGPMLDDDAQLEEIEPVEPDAETDIEPLLPAAEALPEAAPPPPPPVVKGKSNTGLIIAVVVLVILVLCCCCVMATGFIYRQDILLWLNSIP